MWCILFRFLTGLRSYILWAVYVMMDTKSISTKKSFAFAALAILFISPDSLLIKLAGMPVSVGSFWRSLGISIGLFFVLYVRGKTVFSNNKIMWLASFISAVGQVTFVYALEQVSVANVLVVFAALPMLFSIFLSYLLMREKLKFKL